MLFFILHHKKITFFLIPKKLNFQKKKNSKRKKMSTSHDGQLVSSLRCFARCEIQNITNGKISDMNLQNSQICVKCGFHGLALENH